jgi:NAD(P)-dependent dehydrogenase (short-subunit alcohol dehydrogenase family)
VIAELSGYKSLNEIVGWYARSLEPAGAAATATAPATTAASGDPLPKKAKAPLSPLPETVEPSVPTDTAPAAVPAGDAAQADADPVRCYVLQARAADLERGAGQHVLDLPRASHVLLVGADTPLSTALCELLSQQGYPVHQLLPGAATRKLDAQRYEVDFSSLAGVDAWHALAAAETGPAGRASVLINLMPCDEAAPAVHLGDARALFLLLKVLAPELRTGAAAWLLNVTGLDGQFGLGLGLGRSGALAVGGAGTLGVAKSAAREWPALRVKCVDAAPGLAPQWLALQLLRELRGLDGDIDAGAGIEVGYTRTGRWRLELRPDSAAPAGTATATAGLTLDAGAVVLVTGGAYGITADIAGMLARLYRPRLVLVGRSALPAPEAESTRDIADEGALRQALIVQLRATRPQLTPAMVNGEFKRIVKERRIRANLEAMRAAGAEVEYHCLDVRDSAALGRLIDGVYARHGRIDGVLHGAGVIGDKLIADKAPEGYDAVFDTKVLPALLMAERLRPAGLKFIAFFSSVAGRFGNAGQCDYAAANEVLNKLAQDLSVRWPAVHTLAINWGPWDAGMVDDGLRRLYAARSIRPIPVDEGQRHFMQALGAGARGTPELVVSASVRQIAALKLGAPATATANNTASVAAVAAPAPPQQAGPAAPPTPFMPALPIHPTMSAISGEPS